MFANFQNTHKLAARNACCRIFWMGLALTVVFRTGMQAREHVSKDDRLELIRGLSSEIAVAKRALPRGTKGVDVNSQRVKKMLSSVLDFERHTPTTLYSPSVPPKFKDAIKNHQVMVGMDHDGVLSSKGPPDRKIREMREGIEREDWIYGLPPHSLFV